MAVFSTTLVFYLAYSFFYLIYSAIDSFQSTFQLLHCSSLLFKACLCSAFLVSSQSVPPFFSEILDHLFCVFTLNSFSVDCLYPLHLVVLTGFYLVPSSVTSFCHLLLSNFLCLWSLLPLKGCRIVIHLVLVSAS